MKLYIHTFIVRVASEEEDLEPRHMGIEPAEGVLAIGIDRIPLSSMEIPDMPEAEAAANEWLTRYIEPAIGATE